MTLKSKFLVPALLLILAGTSVTTWLTYQRSTESLSTVATDKASSSVEGLLASVELWVEGAQNEIITLSETEEVSNALVKGAGDPAYIERAMTLLKASASRHPTFDSILFIDAKGVTVGSTNPKMVGVDLGGRDYFKMAMKGDNYLSPPFISSALGVPVFVIASPVRSEGKEIGRASCRERV